MKPLLISALLFLLSADASFAALSAQDTTEIEQLARDYASWNFCGRPIDFRKKLDVVTYKEQQPILIELAETDWDGFWGDHWRKCGIPDLAALKALTPEEFIIRYHDSPDNRLRKDDATFQASQIAIDIHSVSEARGFAYVVYTFLNDGRGSKDDGTFYVLRAVKRNGQWLLAAFPGTAKAIEGQLKSMKQMKGIK